MSDQDAIMESLQIVADKDLDLTDSVYQVFFTACPAAVPLMGHSDQYMRGRMLDQVFELLMDDSLQGKNGYFRWEIDNHLIAYHAEVTMYQPFLQAVQDCVQQAVGQSWHSSHEQAWSSRIKNLCGEVLEVSG